MNKTHSVETKIKKTISMIHGGKTWTDVELETGVTRAYLQKLLRNNYYKNDTCYNRLLAIARENEKQLRANTVIITETGALLSGYKIPRGHKVSVPWFCRTEIMRYANQRGIVPEKLLNHPKIQWIPRGLEKLNVRFEKKSEFKPRAIGVVALCCRYINEGKKVICVTNSYEVKKLAELQAAGNDLSIQTI